MDINLILSIALPCISGGTVWGVLSNRVANLEAKVALLDSGQKEFEKELKKEFKEFNTKMDNLLKGFYAIQTVLKYKEKIELEEGN